MLISFTTASGTHPLREALSAFVDSVLRKPCTGDVKLETLQRQYYQCRRYLPIHCYMSEEFASFGEDDVYNQADSAGFINLFGLPIKVKAMLDEGRVK